MARSDANAAGKRPPGTKTARKRTRPEVPKAGPGKARQGGALQYARPEFLLGYFEEIIRALVV